MPRSPEQEAVVARAKKLLATTGRTVAERKAYQAKARELVVKAGLDPATLQPVRAPILSRPAERGTILDQVAKGGNWSSEPIE